MTNLSTPADEIFDAFADQMQATGIIRSDVNAREALDKLLNASFMPADVQFGLAKTAINKWVKGRDYDASAELEVFAGYVMLGHGFAKISTGKELNSLWDLAMDHVKRCEVGQSAGTPIVAKYASRKGLGGTGPAGGPTVIG